MLKLNENFEVHRKVLECHYIRYSPAKTSIINTPNSQIYINIPTEVSVISLLKSYLEIKFEVIKNTDSSSYGDGNELRLFNL